MFSIARRLRKCERRKMGSVSFEGKTYEYEPDETVLDCLTRHGADIPFSCRSGICQSCMVQSENGPPPAQAQSALRDPLKSRGYFLSCMCPAEDGMALRRGEANHPTPARVLSVDRLSERVARLRLQCEDPPEHAGGQFFNLRKPDGVVRSYSVASVPAVDSYIEFHVGYMPKGQMSGWVFNEAQPGAPVELLGPQGQCCYVPGQPDQPMLLAGTGTGLAPLYAILRDAIARHHRGPIRLFHGSVAPEGLYLVDELRALASQARNVEYYPCVLRNGTADIPEAAIDALAFDTVPDLKGWRVFLCGDPALVKTLQRKTFMAGASLQEIFADAFLPSLATQPAGK